MTDKGVILDVKENWECLSCARQHVTTNAGKETPLHQCPKHNGAWIPFVREGAPRGQMRVNERQDYIGTDTPWTDADGRIVQSVTTERAEGEDCYIFAPTINKPLREDQP